MSANQKSQRRVIGNNGFTKPKKTSKKRVMYGGKINIPENQPQSFKNLNTFPQPSIESLNLTQNYSKLIQEEDSGIKMFKSKLNYNPFYKTVPTNESTNESTTESTPKRKNKYNTSINSVNAQLRRFSGEFPSKPITYEMIQEMISNMTPETPKKLSPEQLEHQDALFRDFCDF